MRYLIYGAGAVGGVIGATLAEVGCQVSLVARGPHHDAIRDGGLLFRTPHRAVRIELPVVSSVEELEAGSYDAVILAVKSQDTPAAVSEMAVWAPSETALICAQNGVENERFALRYFQSVYGARVNLPAAHLQPGCVNLYAAPVNGILDVGRFPYGTDPISQRLSEDFNRAGFSSRSDPDIMRWKYRKLLMNLTNAVDALFESSKSDAQRLAALAITEGEACLAAAKITVASVEEDRIRRQEMGPHGLVEGRSYPGNSSWQSLARGTATTEVDYLNGEVVRLGRLHDVPTPVNAFLQTTIRSVARGGRPDALPSLESINTLLRTEISSDRPLRPA